MNDPVRSLTISHEFETELLDAIAHAMQKASEQDFRYGSNAAFSADLRREVMRISTKYRPLLKQAVRADIRDDFQARVLTELKR